MKRVIAFLVSFAVMFFSLSAFASQEIEIKMIIDNPKVIVNGEEIIIDVPPTIINGRTLVPIRFVAERLGAEVEYDAPTRTVTIRMPNAKVILETLSQVKNELTELKEKYQSKQAQIEEMETTLEVLREENMELTLAMEELIRSFEEEKVHLLETINELEHLVEDLRERLASGGGGLIEESNPPVISLSNINDGQSITEEFKLQGTIEDESPIAFVRIKIGSLVIHEGKTIAGIIHPSKLISGEYSLTVEAIDAFGNKGLSSYQIKIANAAKDEPLKLTAKIMDMSAMGGGAFLYATTINHASSYVEILNVEVFNARGERFELMPGVSFLDAMMMQFEMKHMMIHHDDKISLPVAMDIEDSGKPAKEYFNNWKIRVTYFDPLMQKELMLETTYKG